MNPTHEIAGAARPEPISVDIKTEDQAREENPPVRGDSSLPRWVPDPVKNIWKSASDWTARTRKHSIEVTPAFAVNNASNVLGASHVATEMLMFKSGMKGAKLVDNPENPINWVKQPFDKIKNDILTNSEARDYSLKQLFRGNLIKNFKHYVMDTHDASLREAERQIEANAKLVTAGKAAKKLSLGNPWQTRTTGTGIIIWSLSTIIPERKETDAQIEEMSKMRTLHPIQYVGERLRQAVWFPDWMSHKREMLGLGYLAIGTLSCFGAWRQRRSFDKGMLGKDAELVAKGLKDSYTFNGAYFFTGVVSFLAGLPLLFALDERKAYSTYGSLSLLRIPLLPSSIFSKMQKGEIGWQSYGLGKILFQFEDFAFSLIGGATKRKKPDGTYEIIDHEELKKKAIREAKAEKTRVQGAETKLLTAHSSPVHTLQAASNDGPTVASKEDMPSTTVSQSSEPTRAMPEKVAQANAVAANDDLVTIESNAR